MRLSFVLIIWLFSAISVMGGCGGAAVKQGIENYDIF
jgi:hypothetical protein